MLVPGGRELCREFMQGDELLARVSEVGTVLVLRQSVWEKTGLPSPALRKPV